ncbi:class I SAM-dependent methyltransferase [Reichenbachiella ulvae]|uniref:Class I SAM-dependent methyltransferase n=1 Tax=Reichenbachiella ulvae TaxID=2980104 RepID=A0ABT3CTL2_9BACT|nr:class I SAM-dependent methyltransferase [Reichenbachiella ulvae]MCV9387041.1 class I SAM-dependent methyltransferase [Reichenbachiella ulvae]
MSEFWEAAFSSNEKMWGENPTDNSRKVLELFRKHPVRSVLIPGFGYGRNAKVFYEAGMEVSGIEISQTAIARARKYFGEEVILHHGSVADMPFDEARFDAIYCYSLIHLLDPAGRAKLIADSYSQLLPDGLMVFVALSTRDVRYGVGDEIAPHTYLSPHGLQLYFYDEAAIEDAFGNYNIIDRKAINEPEDKPTEKHWMVVCQKTAS